MGQHDADPGSIFKADRHFDNKWRIEQKIRALAFPSYTILRPAFFMENFLSPLIKPRLLEGKLSLALKPDTALQMIAVEDIGKFLQVIPRLCRGTHNV